MLASTLFPLIARFTVQCLSGNERGPSTNKDVVFAYLGGYSGMQKNIYFVNRVSMPIVLRVLRAGTVPLKAKQDRKRKGN